MLEATRMAATTTASSRMIKCVACGSGNQGSYQRPILLQSPPHCGGGELPALEVNPPKYQAPLCPSRAKTAPSHRLR
jgi:hypothetical protein